MLYPERQNLRRAICLWMFCLLIVSAISIPASARTRLKARSSTKQISTPFSYHALNPLQHVDDSFPDDWSDTDSSHQKAAEIRRRLNALEAPVKHLYPGISLDDPTVYVDPKAQPELAEFRELLAGMQALLGQTPEVAPSISTESEPNDTAAQANSLNPLFVTQVCSIAQGSISSAGDVDYFSFTVTVPGTQVWALVDTGGGASPSSDSRLDLFDTDGLTLIEFDDDDGTGNACDDSIESSLSSVIAGPVIATPGTYFLRVTESSGTSTISAYTLHVVLSDFAATPETEPNDNQAQSEVLLGMGQPLGLITGSVSPAGNFDFFSVEAEAGDRIFISVDGDPERDGTSTDVDFLFRAPDGTIVSGSSSSNSGGFDGEGVCFNITLSGTHLIRTEGAGGSATGTYTIMAANCGTLLPCTAITCPADISQTNDAGQCSAVVTFPTPFGRLSCGPITCVPASGSMFPVGATTVTCTAMAGPMCSFTITVTDDELPMITCPADITQNNDTGQCSAVVTFMTPTPTDNCPGATVTCSPASGSAFPVGTTTVTCTATDASMNMASCTFNVTVNDTEPPSITCPANILQGTDAGQCSAVVTYMTPVPTDNCPGATATCSPLSGSTFLIGTTTVTCTAVDAVMNSATCSFTITVADTEPPAITCPADIVVTGTATAGSCGFTAVITYTTPTPTDNCPGPTAACIPASGSTFMEGVTTVTCTATDAAGNTTTCTFTVTVGSDFDFCAFDDATGDSFSIVTDTTSPSFGYWRYTFALTGATICGTANYVNYIPNIRLRTYDNDYTVENPLYFMDATFGPTSGTVYIRRKNGTLLVYLRDRNLANNPPCN